MYPTGERTSNGLIRGTSITNLYHLMSWKIVSQSYTVVEGIGGIWMTVVIIAKNRSNELWYP